MIEKVYKEALQWAKLEAAQEFAEKLDKFIVGKYPVEDPITDDIRQKIIELLKEYVGGVK